MNHKSGTGSLHDLARLHGIQTAYYDVLRRRRIATDEALLAMLKALGAPLQTIDDAANAICDYQQSLWSHPLEPVTVAWNGQSATIDIRLPLNLSNKRITGRLTLENREQSLQQWTIANLPTVDAADVEGRRYVVKQALLSQNLPWGYHTLDVEIAGKTYQTLIISAPQKAYRPQQKEKMRGIFAPLYSLHSDGSWGIGDYSDLERFMSLGAQLGSRLVATLPLLPLFDEEPSPYRPLSRLFWNELYIDVNAVPELTNCDEAQAILESQTFLSDLEQVRRSDRVDYKNVIRLKRMVIEVLCRYIFSGQSEQLQKLQEFARQNPQAEDYASFRAVCETQGRPWQQWPVSLRDGVIADGDFDEQIRRYHLYAQWLADCQVSQLCEKAKQIDNGLYLDLPLGVHSDGYDAWRQRDSFIQHVSAGAPPDVMFTSGQNWGFGPLHPEAIRRSGYSYIRAYLRHHMAHASILRIDHVMGLHRLFCIPNGMKTRQGVYLRYHAEELYAILVLESHRSKTMIVGEDLGTVPFYVRPMMKRHGFYNMYVLQYELAPNPQIGLPSPPTNSVASLNTHDMPPFAAYWHRLSIEDGFRFGLLDKSGERRENKNLQDMKRALLGFLRSKGWLSQSEEDTIAVLTACLSFLAASHARVLIINMEDLWQETRQQNIPGTTTEYPNWQHKVHYRLGQFC